MTETAVKLTNGYHNGHPDDLYLSDILKAKTKELPNGNYYNKTVEPKHLNGPNQVIPATEYTTSTPNGYVKIRMGNGGIGAEQPISIPGLLNRTVARHPDVTALATRDINGIWDRITYREYQQMVFTCAKAFLKLGLERHHSVAILGFNSVEWFVSDLAAIHAGGIAVGVYTTNSAEACHHVLSNSRANIVVVQDNKQMEKINSIWSRLPDLKAVIQWEGEPKQASDKVYTWNQIMEIGRKENDMKLVDVMKTIAINECCTLVYTSGTVGNPKGTMLSHDNLIWEVLSISNRIDLIPGEETLVSFLPLSHVAAQAVDIYLAIMNAASIYFADKDALKGSLVKTLQEVQPTRFIAVPRVWEKMYEKMSAISASSGFVKHFIASWAKQQSLNHYMDMIDGTGGTSQSMKLARWLVLNRVKTALGLKRCRLFVTAAAPLAVDIKKYFLSLDIPIMDVFGMSELSGAHSISFYDSFNLESVGRPLNGSETKIDNKDPKTGDGEVCIRGRHTFMGYLYEKKKTDETFDEDGWMHSGDVGKIDEKGHLYITGRIKELLITAGGENVAPVIIEQQLKAELPILSQAMVIGDRRKFLCVLLTLKTEIDKETAAPLDELTSEVRKWLEKLGSSAKTVSELRKYRDENVWKAIQDGIDRTNNYAISNAQKIQKFAILPSDFSIHTGEMGPTMKIKRNVVVAKYENIISELYGS